VLGIHIGVSQPPLRVFDLVEMRPVRTLKMAAKAAHRATHSAKMLGIKARIADVNRETTMLTPMVGTDAADSVIRNLVALQQVRPLSRTLSELASITSQLHSGELAIFMTHELKSRLAWGIGELNGLSFSKDSPVIRHALYGLFDAFTALTEYSAQDDQQDIDSLSMILRDIELHQVPSLALLSYGVYEQQSKYPARRNITEEDHHKLWAFASYRVSIQNLCRHYLTLYTQDKAANKRSKMPSPEPLHIGIVNRDHQLLESVQLACARATKLCQLQHGDRTPRILIQCSPTIRLVTIRSHLEYILEETIKNACAASVEHQRPRTPIHVTCQDDPIEQSIKINITDYGDGIPKNKLQSIWLFGNSAFCDESHGELRGKCLRYALADPPAATAVSSLAGMGFGLPMSKLLTNFYGGQFTISSRLGEGTVVSISLKSRGASYVEPFCRSEPQRV
jgi:signal transduction histidine kinase